MVTPLSAIAYHEQTKHTPEEVRSGGGLDFANKPTPYKRYRDLRTEPLPDSQPIDEPTLQAIRHASPNPSSMQSSSIDRQALANLCHYATGVTKEIDRGKRSIAFRAAACTGALYHIDLYLIVGDLPDLQAGVYHFDPEHDQLDVLRTGDHRGIVHEATQHDSIAEAPLSIVATSTWWRNAWKYGERTFRHAFWDTGTIGANLLAVAHAGGTRAEALVGFADAPIVRLLGLDPADEAPIAILSIGEDHSVNTTQSVDRINPETKPLSPDPTSYPVIERAWRAGMLKDGASAASWRQDAIENALSPQPPADANFVPLDPVDDETASARPLSQTIERRGSCREYKRESVSFRAFSTILDRALTGLPMPPRSSETPALGWTDCYAIVHAVEGLSPGTYRLSPDGKTIAMLQEGSFRREAGHLALDQPLGANAAVCLFWMADLDALTDALGDRGYRLAQVEAALSAGRCYLGTYAHRRLGGTGLTFYDDQVTAFLSPHAATQTPMFLYTIGRPA